MIYQFGEYIPVVHESSFVHPQAAVTGNVVIGRDCYIGPGAALRGDWGSIVLEDGCNVQENCTIHVFPGAQVRLAAGAHIGHGAVIHGACVGANSMVGMNAVLMDEAVVGAGCIIGALCLVPSRMQIPDRKVVMGIPARIVKDVSDEMLAWKTEGTALYQALPAQLHAGLKQVEPLRRLPEQPPAEQATGFAPWRKS